MKIGFIYYNFYPITGGASVHGFNLARELSENGYELFKLNGEPDPFTVLEARSIFGLFRILKHSDLIYLRMDYFFNFRNLCLIFAYLAGKKIVVELNSPSDELRLFGRGSTYIRFIDRLYSWYLQRANAVVVVSEPLQRYCKEALGLDHVYIIENGGEVFEAHPGQGDAVIAGRLVDIRKKFAKLIVWSGSPNKMQDLERLRQIATAQKKEAAILVIAGEESSEELNSLKGENIFIFRKLHRNEVKQIILESDIGLAFYTDYPWSRWGFYNSSLKIFEYLNNGLFTITNKPGTPVQAQYPNFRVAETTEEIITLIGEHDGEKKNIKPVRTWKEVAVETSELFKKVISR